MRHTRIPWLIPGGLLGAGALACGTGQPGAAHAAHAANATGAASAAALPAGYHIRTDDPKKSAADIRVSAQPTGRLEVNAGTHDQNLGHILYRDADTATGSYTVRTDIDQLGGPEHPEAVGLFIGGRDLAGAGETYGYFIVRGDGQYSIKRRRGDSAATVVPFTASRAVPKADSARHATYRLAVRVGPDSVRFLVGDTPVAAVARTAIPTEGTAGFRINHGLHVIVTPLAFQR